MLAAAGRRTGPPVRRTGGRDRRAGPKGPEHTVLMTAIRASREKEDQQKEAERLVNLGDRIHQKDAYQWTALMHAAYVGNKVICKMLLEQDVVGRVDVDARGVHVHLVVAHHMRSRSEISNNQHYDYQEEKEKYGVMTALMIAAMQGYYDICVMLVEANADVHQRTKEEGESALMIAAKRQNSEICRFLSKAEEQFDPKKPTPRTALMSFAEQGREDMCQLLLSVGAKVDAAGPGRRTALIEAAEKSETAICNLLLKAGAGTREITELYGSKSLLWAAIFQNEVLCRMLLEAAQDIDHEIFDIESESDKEVFPTAEAGMTALLFAVESGNEAIFKMLLEANANVNAQSHTGKTSLYLAASKQEDMCEPLLNAGACVEAKTKNNGETALFASATSGFSRACEVLLNHGAKTEVAESVHGSTPLIAAARHGHDVICLLLLKAKADTEATNKVGKTALIISAEKGYAEVCQILLQGGASKHAKVPENGNTALISAAENEKSRVCQMLLEAKASVNEKNNVGKTALIISAEKGYAEVCQILLQGGANIEAKDENGNTALISAAENEKSRVCQMLLEAKASVNEKNNFGYFPLLFAAQRKNVDLCQILLKAKADPDSTLEEEGSTALHYAAMNGGDAVCHVLLEAHANANLREKEYGYNALMVAAKMGHTDVCRILVDAGVELHGISKDGTTALDIAIQNRRPYIIDLLRESIRAREMGVQVKGIGTAVAAGGVQFFDFVSDIAVVSHWMGPRKMEMEERGLWWLWIPSVLFMSLSVLAGMIMMFAMMFPESWTNSEEDAEDEHRNEPPPHKTFSQSVSSALTLILPATNLIGVRNTSSPKYSPRVSAVLTLLLPTMNLHVLFMGMVRELGIERQTLIFFLSKALETIIEAVPLSVLMVVDLVVTPAEATGTWEVNPVTASSLGLSLFSMAYGLHANAVHAHGISGSMKVTETFLLMILDVVWFLSSMGMCLAAFNLGVWRFGAPLIAFGVQCLSVPIVLSLLTMRKNADSINKAFWAPNNTSEVVFLFQMIAFLVCVATYLCVGLLVTFPFVTFDGLYSINNDELYIPVLIILRRVSLVVLSILGVTQSPFFTSVPVWITVLCISIIALLHTYLSLRFYYNIGRIKFDVAGALHRVMLWCAKMFVSSRVASLGDNRAEETGLDSMAETSMQRSFGHGIHERQLPVNLHEKFQRLSVQAWQEKDVRSFVDVAEPALMCFEDKKLEKEAEAAQFQVQRLVEEVVEQLGKWDWENAKGLPTVLVTGRVALTEYLPDGKHDMQLVRDIRKVFGERETDGVDVLITVPHDSSSRRKPLQAHKSSESGGNSDEHGAQMFGLRVEHAANESLWKDSKGSPDTHKLCSQLDQADRCWTFISHSWHDDWRKKTRNLRLHLLLQQFRTASLALGLLLALELLPMGFLIQALTGMHSVWFGPSVFGIGIAFASILWAELSGKVFPAKYGPWRWVESTVWLDKCCIDQASDETKQAGIARLEQYLERCDSVTVMLGKTYFERLWCTYELACFCKKRKDLNTSLRFVSLEWGWWTNIQYAMQGFDMKQLEEWEEELLSNYSCRNAKCFMPKDRATVLGKIRDEWGTEEKFDKFVQTRLKELLMQGKRRFVMRPFSKISETLTLLFY